ncbi:hypothetical protein [Priestia megaterium]|uniref:hypothetical protein n=1 Tax=Priestia megaterium TaxID=1404 RepID=UPI000BF77C6A|nr:hypothetical protein [Priestia megaterium]PFW43786.1 hypothetical protein COL17_26625 [Priestia megaterium]
MKDNSKHEQVKQDFREFATKEESDIANNALDKILREGLTENTPHELDSIVRVLDDVSLAYTEELKDTSFDLVVSTITSYRDRMTEFLEKKRLEKEKQDIELQATKRRAAFKVI